MKKLLVAILVIGSSKSIFANPNIKHSRGLHGYIGYSTEKQPPNDFNMGMGFYTAVWPLVDKPLTGFQIGLPGCWIMPDNSDNKDKPLAPNGTRARNWKERGPTWSSVFQTLEGGLGYWRGNQFRYDLPKFSMNATPQCYDYEVGSPGWSFFYNSKALPDDQLGIAQLSNRLLIPPDGLTFNGKPNGEFMGYSYMALPFTDPVSRDLPTGSFAWTCFINTANFKGPIAYYLPETWSKIAKIFDYPFLHGRGLDSRPGIMNGGAMEINTVPCFEDKYKNIIYSKIPQLNFPVDKKGQTILVQDVTYYSKNAIYNDFLSWRKGGDPYHGGFKKKGAWRAKLKANPTTYSQAGMPIVGIENIVKSHVYNDTAWGLKWENKYTKGKFPQYFQHDGDQRIPITTKENIKARLKYRKFPIQDNRGKTYTSPKKGAWQNPGPEKNIYKARLADGSLVHYRWYKFINQPTFQQYNWSKQKKAALQNFVEKIHSNWTIEKDYMEPLTTGDLVELDRGLIVKPPTGLEIGYVPIVIKQTSR